MKKTDQGLILTYPFLDSELQAGMVGVVFDPIKQLMEMGTIMHVDKGTSKWYAETQSFGGIIIDGDAKFCKLVVASSDGKLYALKFSQWKKVLSLVNETDKTVAFEIEPIKFKDGNYRRECSNCDVIFIGDRRQIICKECCNGHATATILFKKEFENKEPNNSIQKALREAYDMGRKCVKKEEFEKWLNKTVKHGNLHSSNHSHKKGESEHSGNHRTTS